MDKIWEETLARIDELEKQVIALQNFIVPGINDKADPEPGQKTQRKRND